MAFSFSIFEFFYSGESVDAGHGDKRRWHELETKIGDSLLVSLGIPGKISEYLNNAVVRKSKQNTLLFSKQQLSLIKRNISARKKVAGQSLLNTDMKHESQESKSIIQREERRLREISSIINLLRKRYATEAALQLEERPFINTRWGKDATNGKRDF